MLPVVSGARATRRQILAYTFALVLVSLLPWALGYAGYVYGGAATALAVGFVWLAVRVVWDTQDAAGVSQTRDAPARALFRYSLLYLFVLFLAVGVDAYV